MSHWALTDEILHRIRYFRIRNQCRRPSKFSGSTYNCGARSQGVVNEVDNTYTDILGFFAGIYFFEESRRACSLLIIGVYHHCLKSTSRSYLLKALLGRLAILRLGTPVLVSTSAYKKHLAFNST
jgi:hypothetical protein